MLPRNLDPCDARDDTRSLRPVSLDRTGKMPARERSMKQLANRLGIRARSRRERVERRAIPRDDRADVVARHVEHQLISPNSRAPQLGQELGPVDRTRM